MKIITLFLAAFMIFNSAASQTKDTVKAYDYMNFHDAWKLRLLEDHSFELVLDCSFFPNSNFLTGKYIVTKDSIQLLPDADSFSIIVLSAIKESKLLKDPIKELVSGTSFLKSNEYIIPPKKNDPNTSLFGKYYRGHDLGKTEIEIFKNGIFIITEFFCTGKFVSKGKYIKAGDLITFIPGKKSAWLLSRITRGQTAFVKNNYLVCRNFQERTTSYVDKNVVVDKTVTDDVFSYFLKIE